MSKTIYFDNRWGGKNGIGRYSFEIGSRLNSSKIRFICGKAPTDLREIFRIFRNMDSESIIYSPGYIALLGVKKQFVTIHDLILLKKGIGSIFQRFYFNYFLKQRIKVGKIRVITVSEYSKQELVNWTKLSPKEISIVPNGISDSILQAGYELNRVDRGRSLIYVGNNKLHKNFDLLIKATEFLKCEWKIVLVGKGLNSLNFSKRHSIYIHEGVSDLEITSLYLNSDIVVTTSLFEGFCMPVLEGSFLGCKVVHTGDLPTVKEIIGDASFHTNQSKKPEDLARVIEFANDSPLKMNENFRLALANRFSWDRSADLLNTLLTQMEAD
jgi:glycosyltransferase involved in cell wall biosynthesis